MQQKNLQISRRDLYLAAIALACLVFMIGGFAYFYGRYQQVQLDKSVLSIIPDVNCGGI